jgi:hypothetical protein
MKALLLWPQAKTMAGMSMDISLIGAQLGTELISFLVLFLFWQLVFQHPSN